MGGIKLRCTTPQYEAGGGGINVSKAIARLGGTSVAFYTCGGTTGDLVGELLDKEAIGRYPVRIEDPTRQNLSITEKSRTPRQQHRVLDLVAAAVP